MSAGKGLLWIFGGAFALTMLFAIANPDGGQVSPTATSDPNAIAESAVTLPCRDYIARQTKHDVKYPTLEQQVKTSAKGGVAVIGFRANNAFNAWTHYTAVCTFDVAANKLDANIYEASFRDTMRQLTAGSGT